MKSSEALLLVALMVGLETPDTAHAQVVLGDPEQVDVSSDDAESLGIIPKGNFIQVAALPGASNTVPVVLHGRTPSVHSSIFIRSISGLERSPTSRSTRRAV